METVETLNTRLVEHFGIDSDTSRPMFRIVWAPEQTEKRLMEVTDSGMLLLTPEVREVRKYPFFKNMYVLERLVVVPEMQQKELADVKLSYEPIWTYKDAHDNPMVPRWDVTKIVIDVLYAAMGKKSLHKYVDPESTEEGREAKISGIQEELFGNETDVTDALAYKTGVVVPHNFQKKEE